MSDDWHEQQRRQQEQWHEQQRRDQEAFYARQREESRRDEERRYQEQQRFDQERRDREASDRAWQQQQQREQEERDRRQYQRQEDERMAQHARDWNDRMRREEDERSRPRKDPWTPDPWAPRPPEPAWRPSPPQQDADFPRSYDRSPSGGAREPVRPTTTDWRWLGGVGVVIAILAAVAAGVAVAPRLVKEGQQAAARAHLKKASDARIARARTSLPAGKTATRRFLLAALANPAIRRQVARRLPFSYGSVIMEAVPTVRGMLQAATRSPEGLARQARDPATQFALVQACAASGAKTDRFDLRGWVTVFKPIYYESDDASLRARLDLLDVRGETGTEPEARRLAGLIMLVLREGTAR